MLLWLGKRGKIGVWSNITGLMTFRLRTHFGHGMKHGLGQFLDDVEFADLVSNVDIEIGIAVPETIP